MNIKDFSLNDVLSNINSTKISGSRQSVNRTIRKSSNSNDLSSSSARRGSVTRERVNPNSNNLIKAEDGSVFDKSAPKGTYVNLVI